MPRDAVARDLGGVHLRTVDRLIEGGKLVGVKIGRRMMITTASVEALIEGEASSDA